MRIREVQRVARRLDAGQLRVLEGWIEARRSELEEVELAGRGFGLVLDVLERLHVDGVEYWLERWRCPCPGCWCRRGRWHRGAWWARWQDESGAHLQCFGVSAPQGVQDQRKTGRRPRAAA